jgi:hypothetical protein
MISHFVSRICVACVLLIVDFGTMHAPNETLARSGGFAARSISNSPRFHPSGLPQSIQAPAETAIARVPQHQAGFGIPPRREIGSETPIRHEAGLGFPRERGLGFFRFGFPPRRGPGFGLPQVDFGPWGIGFGPYVGYYPPSCAEADLFVDQSETARDEYTDWTVGADGC